MPLFFSQQPLHAVSPSLSTHVPQAPLGTPATNFHQPSKLRSSSPTKQAHQGIGEDHMKEANTTSEQGVDASNPEALGTIQEVYRAMATSYQDTSAMDTSHITSPGKRVSPISTPWGNCTSFTAGPVSDRASRSPVPPMTPRPSTASPESSWPEVDERDFMNSPEKPRETISVQTVDNMTTPTAPPPSPEPEMKNDFEFAVNDMSKSAVTSLMPLVEEGEEEGEDEEEEELDENIDDVKEDGQVDTDITEEDQVIRGKRDEIQTDFGDDKTQQSATGDPFTHEIQNENGIDVSDGARGNEDIAGGKGNAREDKNGTALDSFEPDGENIEKSMSDINTDGLNLDTIQEGLGDPDADRERVRTTELHKQSETEQEAQDNKEGMVQRENETDFALHMENSIGNSTANQEASDSPHTANETTGEKLDSVMTTNEGRAVMAPDEGGMIIQEGNAYAEEDKDATKLQGEDADKEQVDDVAVEKEEQGEVTDTDGAESPMEDSNKQAADSDIDNKSVLEDTHHE